MQDKALQSEKMQDNPAKSRTVGNSVNGLRLMIRFCATDGRTSGHGQ